MRETTAWRRHRRLSNDIDDAWRDKRIDGFGVSDLLDTELGLYLLDQIAKQQRPDSVWTLLNGYPIAEAIGVDLNDRQRQMLRVGREMLSARRNPYGWRKAINDYARVPEQLRGYLIQPDELAFHQRSPRVAPHRFDIFDDALAALPRFRTTSVRPAPPGQYLVSSARGRSGVTIPPWLPSIPPAAGHDIRTVRKRTALTVTYDMLLETARWAAKAEERLGIKPGDWEKRLGDVEFTPVADGRPVKHAEDEPPPPIEINGMFHLLGMVGAGKSTLMDLLCMWAAKNDKRITVVVGDVTSLLRKVVYFNALGLNAAPVVGQSNRPRHVERLHRLFTDGDGRLTAAATPGRRRRGRRNPGHGVLPAGDACDRLDHRGRGLVLRREHRADRRRPCGLGRPRGRRHCRRRAAGGRAGTAPARKPVAARPAHHGGSHCDTGRRHRHGARSALCAVLAGADPRCRHCSPRSGNPCLSSGTPVIRRPGAGRSRPSS